LSARTPSALDNAREALAQHLESHPDTNLADAAFTLQLGRRAFEHRLAVTARNREEASDALARNDPSRLRRGKSGEEPQAVFMFPGQGSQRLGMARRLYEEEPVVR